MEIHRIKTFTSKVDEMQFNQLYTELIPLKMSLVKGIDARRFGVSPDEIASWFDDKLLYVYQKYMDKDMNVIKGFIINSLKNFKNKMLRRAYQENYKLYDGNIISIDDLSYVNLIPDETSSPQELLSAMVTDWFKLKLTKSEFEIFLIQTYPPEYILHRIPEINSRITNKLIIEFLDLPQTKKTLEWVSFVRNKINLLIPIASKELSLS